MARISKHHLRETVMNKTNSLFYEIFHSLNSEVDFFEIVNEILSPTEQIMISKRIVLMYLLIKNIEYDIISDTLKISQSTIAKFSLLLQRSPHIKDRLWSIAQNDRIELLFQELYSAIFSPGTIGASWKAARIRRVEINRKKLTGI